MKRIITLSLLVCSSIHPFVGSEEYLIALERGQDPETICNRLCLAGVFDPSEARKFIQDLKREIQKRYGIKVDLRAVSEKAIEEILQSGFTREEAELAREFYKGLLEDQIHEHALNKGNKKKKTHKKPELHLPDKLAMGFACILGGALLCVVPTIWSQGIGAGLITMGCGFAFDGVQKGEKPYYVDPDASALLAPGIP